MNLDTVPASSIPGRAGSSNAALLSGGLLLSAIVVNIGGSRVMESFPYENDTGVAVIWNLGQNALLDVGFILAVWLRSLTPGRRVPAVITAVLAASTGTGTLALKYILAVANVAIPSGLTAVFFWVANLGSILYVVSWGLARRRHPLWAVGLIPALVVSIGSAFLIAAPWPSKVVENIGWWLIWPLLWWCTIAVGCLACWGFDAIAGSRGASKTAAPVAAKPEYIQQTPGGPPAGPVVGTNAMAIAALVSSLVFAPLGIVFGHISLSQIKRTGEDGKGLAIAGLAIGYLGAAIFLLWLVVFGVFFMAGLGSATY